MKKTCKKCSKIFEITKEDLEFYKKVSPKIWWKIFEIPTPTFCGDCRNQRRLTWRNESKLYRRKCDATGKSILSVYSPDKKYVVYEKDYFHSDDWDVMDYFLEVDFQKSFFEQFDELLHKVPLQNLSWWYFTENSKYINFAGRMKDCYMTFASWMCEKVLYSSRVINSNNVIDSLDWTDLEYCYETYNCLKCYKTTFSFNSNNCKNSDFLINCENCENCFLSYNLVWKRYFIENIEYSKKEYFEKIEKIKNNYLNIGWKILDKIKNKAIYRNLLMVNTENSFWDNLKNCKNCNNCFHLWEAENCNFVENWWYWTNNTYDGLWVWENLNLGYEILDTWINATGNYFLITCYTCQKTFYSINCHNSDNLFWCIWLQNKKYCIFNKQYSKQEYENIVPKIIEKMKINWEWWEFFPANLSPFWYNETIAQEFIELSEKEIIKQNFNYSNYKSPEIKVEKLIPASKLPENISDIPDDILNWAIKCEVSEKPFRIISQELEFYRKHNLPIPKKHPDIRYLERIKLRNPRKLFDRDCDKCWNNMKTSYNKNRKETVYCQKCYNDEIY